MGFASPPLRSLAVGLTLLALGSAGYVGARETSVFAVRSIEVRGGSPRIRAEVRAALAAENGRSLLRIDGADLQRRLAGVPDVSSVTYDRVFPGTLRVVAIPERPVLILRRGSAAWLVSSRGRVLRALRTPRRSRLPQAWVPRETSVAVGRTLGAKNGGTAAAALAPLSGARLGGGIRFVRATPKELTLVLQNGLELRLGGLGDLRLKLGIARKILATAAQQGAFGGYLDVSVPERPVLNLKPPVEGRA